MRFRNVRIVIFSVTILLLLFGFQNCSKFEVQSNSPETAAAAHEADEIFSKLAECPTDNWQSYCQSTQKTPIDWHDYISFEPLDDTYAAIYNGYQTYIFNSATQRFKQIQSNEHGQYHSQMGFPSLNRLVLMVKEPKSEFKQLLVFEITTGKRLYKSPPLAPMHNPCFYNPMDEKAGIILCALSKPTPTKPHEVQGTLFDVKNLSFTKLAPIPDNYHWEANWPGGGPTLYSHMLMYPLPKEARAIVQVLDSQRNEVLLSLTPESATPFLEDTVYDYNGSGQSKPFSSFVSESVGFLQSQDSCPTDIEQYPSFLRFSINATTRVNSLCLNGKVWTYKTNPAVELNECTTSISCSPISLNVNGESLYSASSEPGFMKGVGKLYALAAIRSNGQMTLVSVDVNTKQMNQIPLPVVANESVTNYESLARIEIPLLRWYKNSYVTAMRFYVRGLEKIFDLPLIPNIGKANLHLTTARTLEGKAYVYGFAFVGNEHKTLIVQDNQDWLLLDEGLVRTQESYNNLRNSPYLVLQDATRILKYNLLTNQKTVIATTPAGYKPNRALEASPYIVVEYGSTTNSDRRLIVYKDQQVIYTRNGKLNEMIPTNDNKGFWAIYENASAFSGGFGFKYNYETATATADVIISETGLVDSINYTYPTSNGEFLVTQGGRIYDSQFNLVLATGNLALGPKQGQSITTTAPLFKYAYFAKWQRDPNNASQTLSILYRFNFSTKAYETVSGPSTDWHSPAGDYFVTLKTRDTNSTAGSVSIDGNVVIDLPNLTNYETTEKYFYFVQNETNGKDVYSYISHSDLKNATEQGQKAQVKRIEPPSDDVVLASIIGDEVWWQMPNGMQGATHIITPLPK